MSVQKPVRVTYWYTGFWGSNWCSSGSTANPMSFSQAITQGQTPRRSCPIHVAAGDRIAVFFSSISRLGKGFVSINILLCVGLLIPSGIRAQSSWYMPDHGILIAGQSPMLLRDMRILNRSEERWEQGTEIKLVIPDELEFEWDPSNVQVTRWGRKIEITQKVFGRTLVIRTSENIAPRAIIKIKNLKIMNFRGSSPYRFIKVLINNQRADFMDLELLRDWTRNPPDNVILRFISNEHLSARKDFQDDLNVFRTIFPKKSRGAFRIADLKFDLESEAVVVTNTQRFDLPHLIILNDSLESVLTKNTQLTITFPEEFKILKSELEIKPKRKVIGFQSINSNVIQVKVKKTLSSDESISISGIKLGASRMLVPPKKIKLEWKNQFRATTVTLFSQNTIRVGSPEYKLDGDIELVANGPVVTVPRIQITENGKVPAITAERNLFIEIPLNIEAYWSKDFQNISISGSAASKVSSIPYFRGPRLLEFNVTEDFGPGEYVELSGIRVFAKRREYEETTTQRKSLKESLIIHFNRPGSGETRYTKEQIKIVEVEMSSAEPQVILAHDDRKEAKPIRISLKSDFPALKKGDRLRFRLPESLHTFWDPGMLQIELRGLSAEKVSPNVLFDPRRYPRSLILEILEDFMGEEQFEVAGLVLSSSQDPSKGYLELYLNDDTTALARDDESWIIQNPIFSAKEDQLVFDTDSTTQSFSFLLDIRDLTDYFEENDHIMLEIPADIPLEFNVDAARLNLYGQSSMYLRERVVFLNKKRVRLTIAKSIPPRTEIVISGLEYSKPMGVLAHPDTLHSFLSDGSNEIPIRCKKSISIINKKSEFGVARYYHMVMESNFNQGDTLFFDLDSLGKIIWDEPYIKKNLRFLRPPATGNIGLESLLFLNDSKTLGLPVRKTLMAEDYFRIEGLAVRREVETVDDYTYLSVRFVNLYGPQSIILRHPINLGISGKEKESGIPLYLKESYVFPLIWLVNQEDVESLTIPQGQRGRLVIPPLEIQNGDLTVNDEDIYNQFKSAQSNFEKAFDHEHYKRATALAEDLIRLSPNTWLGHYYHAKVLKEEDKLSQSQGSYVNARKHDYVPSKQFPPLFAETIDERAHQDIVAAEELIEREYYLKAEQRLNTVTDQPMDSLRDDLRGTAYYLLGIVALRLNDCIYAKDYLDKAWDYRVMDEELYSFDRADSILAECRREPSNGQFETLVVGPPEPGGDTPLNIKILTHLDYPYRVGIENRSSTVSFSARMGNNIEIESENIYRINAHPVRSQIQALFLALAMTSIFIGLTSY